MVDHFKARDMFRRLYIPNMLYLIFIFILISATNVQIILNY
jgi:hypothetical protein